ncbi:holo-acyl-carrier-protein synthase [Kribbella flavida DSM 17836]|uniref:Holo-[acyl-carrier-protein] synthase n=1 Tax=Kribbella flavida (strain DSM 17836 / JCM 10339 / NBRC 14399) TaxID=479435 RepID=D2PSZ9_KRIFD|nr:holo-ACP synthase [Kribbella flavida]ADB35051.1 holo-acyl-carrier-protein synthase [Kribbella flavida DSM 17836]
MIVGVGIDVVDVERFMKTLERTPGLRDRVFTASEAARPPASLAARFAAKEALAKALGAPAGMHWHDAEVRTDDSGRPWLEITGTVKAKASELGVQSLHLSLSHDAGIASAVVVLEG